MWDRLRAADIEQAKQELERRRVDILARHAREIDELQTSHAEVEALDGLIAAFALKFKAPGNVSAAAPRNGSADSVAAKIALPDALSDGDALLEPSGVVATDLSAAPGPAEPIASLDAAAAPEPKLPEAAQAAAPPPRRAPPPPSGELPRTNFEAFSRAIAKASY